MSLFSTRRDAARSRSLAFPTVLRVLIAVIALCGLAAAPSPALSADASDCIRAMVRAVDNADQKAFEKRVDISGVTGQIFDELQTMGRMEQYQAKMPPLMNLLISQGALESPMIRPLLVSEVRNFVLYGVGSGSFAGKKVENYQNDSMLAPLFNMVSMGRKEIRRIDRPMMGENGQWIVPFSVLDHENGNTYRVLAQVAMVSDGWRMVGISNLRALIEQILLEAQAETV
ncbi:MAG: hypothetical protein Q4F72_03260 [Desulfovibrionaceae bacterium]|nr:hypothetical protein [Desulfovibrionaceae bacterium]